MLSVGWRFFLILACGALVACDRSSQPARTNPTRNVVDPSSSPNDGKPAQSAPLNGTTINNDLSAQPSSAADTPATSNLAPSLQTASVVPTPTRSNALPSQAPAAVGAWRAENVDVTCADARCQPAVGLLTFLKPGNESPNFWRCTATLIAPDQILTTGHCDKPGAKGHFILGSGATKAVRTLVAVKQKVFAGYLEDKRTQKLIEPLEPSYVIYQLNAPITTVTPLMLSKESALRDQATAYVIDELPRDANTPAEQRFVQKAVDCSTRKHALWSLFSKAEAPDLLFGFDCTLVEGNSGAPLLVGESVVGVFQSFLTKEAQAASIFEKFKRAPVNFESKVVNIFTNARCLNTDSQSAAFCTRVSDVERLRRFDAYSLGTLNKFKPAPLRTDTLEFEAFPYLLKSQPEHDRDFQVLYLPKCRRVNWDQLTEIPIPLRRTRLEYDDFAIIRPRELEQRVSMGRVEAIDGNQVRLKMKWNPDFGPMKGVRPFAQIYGDEMSIELPPCAR